MKSKSRWLALIATLAVVFVLVFSLGLSSVFASAASGDEKTDGRYYSDFNSKDEAFSAAEDTNLELTEEGIVLLKNDGTLPLSKGAKVSVLGVAQDCLVETSGTVTDSLRNAGFKVNPTLEEKYLGDGASSSTYGNETALTGTEISSLGMYADAAVVVIARGESGESGERSTNTGEEETDTYLGNPTGWAHEAHETDETGEVEYKHELQLTDSEQELIKIAEDNCKKVIVLYSSANTFEMANLENDPAVNAIAWIGRPGDGGMDAVGEVLCGDVNPSGKTVDEWTRDFTNDPTYANAAGALYYDENGQTIAVNTGSMLDMMYAEYGYAGGTDYEEDIYLGYKFYETYWKEAKDNNTDSANPTEGADVWYSNNVVYPFGYGLSYTDFSFKLADLETDTGTSLMNNGQKASLSGIYNSTTPEGAKSLIATVNVTNEGAVAGRDVVEVYVQAPYGVTEEDGSNVEATGIEKPYVTLVGYAKTGTIQPGKSETVTVSFKLQDMASYDYADMNNDGETGYTLDKGDYTVHVMESSSHLNMDNGNAAYASETFKLETTTVLDLDAYTGNKIENIFSGSDGTPSTGDEWKDDYYSMIGAEAVGSMVSPLTATQSSPSTMLSRSNFDSTMPTGPEETLTLTDEDVIAAFGNYQYVHAGSYDDTDKPWYVDDLTDMAGWTQGIGDAGDDGLYDITLDDMAGLDYDDAQWTAFMNQLTWEEIGDILNWGDHLTAAVPTIGKVQTLDHNGPNHTHGAMYWACEPTIAATWNTELAGEQGRMFANTSLWIGMTGWYGPGVNIHRNQFAGRNPEYYSQDALQCGYIAAAVISGAESMGLNVYVKHFAMYDSAYTYAGRGIQASEQNMRENYLKVFQMAMQEGGASAAMSSITRIGAIYCGQNYALITKLAREEWGWDGFVVTDNRAGLPHMSVDGLIRAGAQIPDGDLRVGTSNEADSLSGTWNGSYDWSQDATYAESAATLSTNAPTGCVMLTDDNGVEFASPTQWYLARVAAQQLLYHEANSAGNMNGITAMSVDKTIAVTQGTSASATLIDESVYGEAAGHSIGASELSSGALPEGLALSGNTLSGTPTSTEGGSATVTVYVDGWIPITVNLTFTVTPVMSIGTDISSATTGTSVSAYVVPDSSLGATSYTVSVSDGALPQGLSLNEATGQISGTPEKAGVYDFTLALTVDGSATYYMPYTITVTGDDYSSSVSSEDLDKAVQDAVDAAISDVGGVTSEEIDAAVKAAVEEAIAGLDLSGATSSSDESSSGNGMAITGLVLGIVAIVLAAVVLVIVLLRGRKKSDD